MEELFGVVDLLRPFVDMFVLFFTVVKKWNAHALARARGGGGRLFIHSGHLLTRNLTLSS